MRNNIKESENGKHIADQRENILKKAGELFLLNGYEKTSVRMLARELGISPGLVTYYYPTKKEIATELFSRQLSRFTALSEEYVSENEPMLRSAVLMKLQYSVLRSATFRSFYLDALREDIIFTVINSTGNNLTTAINEKYDLGFSDDYLDVFGNIIAASAERSLNLYGEDMNLPYSISDLIFMTSVGRLYGSEEFLVETCRRADLITAQILCDCPEILQNWS